MIIVDKIINTIKLPFIFIQIMSTQILEKFAYYILRNDAIKANKENTDLRIKLLDVNIKIKRLEKQLDIYNINNERINTICKNSYESYLVFNKKTEEPIIISHKYSPLGDILTLYKLNSLEEKELGCLETNRYFSYINWLIIYDTDNYRRGYGSLLLSFFINLASKKNVIELSGMLPDDADEDKYNCLKHFYSKNGFEVDKYSSSKHIYIHQKLL